MSYQRIGKIAVSDHQAVISPSNMDFKYDDNLGKQGRVVVSVNKRDIDIYPWGANNRLPSDMVALLRSNGDVSNLLDARLDFLFGAGIGLFRRINDKNDVVFEPYFNQDVSNYLIDIEVNEYADASATHLVECASAFVNVTNEKNYTKLTALDPTTVRVPRLKAGDYKKSEFAISANWHAEGRKNATIIPACDITASSQPRESIMQLMRPQTGQYYYGYAKWWSAKPWIELANRIPEFHNKALDTEYNIAHICRIADQYFDTMFQIEGLETEEDKSKYRDKFYKMIDDLIANSKGGRRVIYDECPVGEDGKLHGWIQIEAVPRTIKGNEYTELYRAAVLAFANASGILSQLSGINDGKVMGGSGSELRVTAEYQQFYRTPREREYILKPLNRLVLPRMQKNFPEMPKDVVFGYNNILLEALNTAKTGSSSVGTGGQNATKTTQKSTQ